MAKINPLKPELQKIAEEELGEVPARIPEDLAALRLWLQHQPHLKAREDDQFLIQFLRGCKYSLEKAKEKLDLYFSLKSKYPEMFNVSDVDNPKFREIHCLGCFEVLPKPLQDSGPRIVIFKYSYSTNNYNIDEIFSTVIAMNELMLINDPNACISGLIYIVDFEQASANHFLQMTPNFCKKLVSFLEKSMPFRIKSVYYINTSTAAQNFFKLLHPFLSEKFNQRIHILGHGLAELLRHIDAQYLPRDYGGELPSVQELTAEYNATWDANREFFKENANFGTDESLRPGKPLDIDGLFGVGGSFRKLNVD